MAFDFKKEYKEFYMPAARPSIVTVPPMNYIAVRGEGDPNAEDGAYKQAIGLLYGIAFTIKMSKKGDHRIEGFFDYVVPPLEGFWWQDGVIPIRWSGSVSKQFDSVYAFCFEIKEKPRRNGQEFISRSCLRTIILSCFDSVVL